MAYNPRDYYFKQAKKQNFAARSVFKLEEIDSRLRIFKKGYKVLDLGAAPGSWSQYASSKVGPEGRILGIDLKTIRITLPNALFIKSDLRELNVGEVFEETGILPPFDVILSDMAPKTTGIRVTDQERSFELCNLAFDISMRFLKKEGHLIVKLFHSDSFEDFRNKLKENFKSMEAIKPKSTRKESKEIFLIGLKKK